MHNNSEQPSSQLDALHRNEADQQRSTQEEQQQRRIQLDSQEAHLQQEKLLLAERTQLVELSAAISSILISKMGQWEMLQHCCEAIIQYLEIDLACTWTLAGEEHNLQLQSSAGDSLAFQAPALRAQLEQRLKQKILLPRHPYICNSVALEDAQEASWLFPFTTFAGYPLIVEEKLLGILGLFTRQPLTYSAFHALIANANAIAVALAHRKTDQERDRLLQLAQEAQDEAEKALTLRNAFLSSVTHDLKSPLTSIIGSYQLLQHRIEKYQPPESGRYLQALAVIGSSTRRMSSMIEDLLDLARLQRGLALDLNRTEEDLVELIQHIVDEHQQESTQHRITIQSSQPSLVALYDKARIERVLANLLSNAIKYSPRGGEIRLEISRQTEEEQEWAQIRIQDEGIGIPANDLPHIFEPFHRANNSRDSIQGTGLGLTSVAQIIEQHEGKVHVISEEGRGTTFSILLPLQRQAANNISG